MRRRSPHVAHIARTPLLHFPARFCIVLSRHRRTPYRGGRKSSRLAKRSPSFARREASKCDQMARWRRRERTRIPFVCRTSYASSAQLLSLIVLLAVFLHLLLFTWMRCDDRGVTAASWVLRIQQVGREQAGVYQLLKGGRREHSGICLFLSLQPEATNHLGFGWPTRTVKASAVYPTGPMPRTAYLYPEGHANQHKNSTEQIQNPPST